MLHMAYPNWANNMNNKKSIVGYTFYDKWLSFHEVALS